MPVIKLNAESQSEKTLADVPKGEIWEDEEGDAVVQDKYGSVLACYNEESLFAYDDKPEDIIVVRKLSDPIKLTW